MGNWFAGKMGWAPTTPTVWALGTPELIYTYAGAEGYVNPTGIADSHSGTLLVSYQIPQVIGGNPDRYGLIEEIDLDGTLLGTVDTYAEPIFGLTTDTTGNYYSVDDHPYERIYRNGDGSDWSDISSLSADYSNISAGIAVNPTDGSVWFVANNAKLFTVNSSGGSLTKYTLGAAGTHRFSGLVWVTDQFWMVDGFAQLAYSYQPGVGFSAATALPSGAYDKQEDITYGPLTGRLYFSSEDNITSVIPGNDPSGQVEISDPLGSAVTPGSIICIGGYLYLTGLEVHSTSPVTATGTVWRIPFVPE